MRIHIPYQKMFLLFTLCGAVGIGAAAETPHEPMTLHDCMVYATRHSTKLRTSAADRGDERAQRRQAIMQAFTPSVSASTYAYNNYGRNIDPETNTYNTVTSFHNGYSLSASLTLFDGFQALNNLRIATTTMKMGASRDEQTRDAVCLATMEAYYNVLYYTALTDVLTRQAETAEAMLRKTAREEELGQKSHADVVQMEAELAKKQYDLTSTANLRDDALLTLKDVMYWPADEELVLESQQDNKSTGEQVNGTTSQLANLSTNHNLQSSLSSLPEAIIARGILENARTALCTARWAYTPSVGLYAGWSTNYFTYPGMAGYTPTPFREQFRANSGEYIQLSMSIPILDRFSRRTTLRLRRNAVERAEAQYDQTMRDIENEIYRAVSDCDGAEAAYRQAQRRAEVEEEAYALSRRRFEQGLISSLDYQTASQAYLNAQAERLGAQFKYQLKHSVVRYYNGTPYLEQEH